MRRLAGHRSAAAMVLFALTCGCSAQVGGHPTAEIGTVRVAPTTADPAVTTSASAPTSSVTGIPGPAVTSMAGSRGGPATGASRQPPTGSASATGPSPSSASPDPNPAPRPVTAWELAPASTIPATWRQAFVAGYGPGNGEIGSAPGGDNGSLTIGPEYAARAADGSWLVLDAAKRRIARLSAGGAFLGSVAVPPPLLADGVNFQYQMPRVLADGTLVAVSQSGESSRLLRVHGGSATGVTTSGSVVVTADDGVTLYGFDPDGALVAVNAATGAVTPTAWFRTQAGNRYRITLTAESAIIVDLPDAPGGRRVTLPLRGPGSARVHASVEVAAGADGALHLFFSGIGDADETVQLAGYATITAAGVATPMEPMRDPSSPADPGSPAHLGVSPGSSSPYLVFVDPQGLRAYVRAAD